jgi:hypothetical protein
VAPLDKDKLIISIQLSAEQNITPVGLAIQLVAIATYDNGTTEDVTEDVNWIKNQSCLNTINHGLVKTSTIGTCEVTATLSTITSNTTALTITDAKLKSIQLTTARKSIPNGNSQVYLATGTYTDSSTIDITTNVNWNSSATNIVTIIEGIAQSHISGTSDISANWSGINSNVSTLTVTNAELTNIQITPAIATIPKGTNQTYIAMGTYTDNTTLDITNDVHWSNNTDILTIVDGTLESHSQGISDISANLSGIDSNIAILTVTSAELTSIQITPATASIPAGNKQKYTATGIYTDSSTADITNDVHWNSNSTSVATIIEGATQSYNAGTSIVSANLSGINSNIATLTVSTAELISIQTTPSMVTIPQGNEQAYIATGVYTDNSTADITNDVHWHSSAIDVSTIVGGRAQTNSNGISKISANLLGINSNLSTLMVTEAVLNNIQITPADTTIPEGNNQSYIATGTYTDGSTADITNDVNWVSDNTNVGTIIAGTAQGNDDGRSEITANLTGIVSNIATLTVIEEELVSIQLTPLSITIPQGNNQTYIATGTYTDNSTSDITNNVNWISSVISVATIVNGTAHSNSMGTSDISANLSGIKSSLAPLTVTAAKLTSIQITPAIASIPHGTAQTYIAIGNYTDGSTVDITNDVNWSSNDTDIVTIVGGFSQSNSSGESYIRANWSGVDSNEAILEVTSAELTSIQITPATASIPKGNNQAYIATGTYTDGSTSDITNDVNWDSTSINIATIVDGSAQAYDEGITDISANLSGINSNISTLTVTEEALNSIQITPATASIPKGNNQAYIAIGTYTDNSTADITNDVNWSSTNTAIVTIVNGVAQSQTSGTSTISANLSSIDSNIATLTVTAVELTSIQITPATASLPAGNNQTYIATGTYSDSSTANITNEVNWSSTNTAVATVVNGSVESNSAGMSNISANWSGIDSNIATLTVTAAELTSIQISPASASVPAGNNQIYIATGTYSDSSTANITNDVNWNSTNTAVATIVNGTIESNNTGMSNISANWSGIDSNVATITVTAAELVSIQITPTIANITLGNNQNYIAIGTYTDGATANITSYVNWNSDDTGVATIVNGNGESNSEGVSNIRANWSGISSNLATITVTAAELVSIQITPSDVSIADGDTQTFTATGTFTDDSELDITSTVTWASSEYSIATITAGAAQSQRGIGDSTISASMSGISDTATLTTVSIVCDSNTGTPALNTRTCLDIVEGTSGDAVGKFFTSSPSTMVGELLRYEEQASTNNVGRTYYQTFAGILRFEAAGGDGLQSERYCQLLATLEFNNSSSWQLPTSQQLIDLHAGNGNMSTNHYWDTAIQYWSSDAGTDSSHKISVLLSSGATHNTAFNHTRYVTCVSD